MSQDTGTVLWYRPTMGRGMVKGDNGRRLFFGAADGIELVAGLRVAYQTDRDGPGPAEASGLSLENGVRTVLDPADYMPQPKTKAKAKTTKKRAPRKSTAKKPKTPKKKAGESMAAGTPVSHGDFGAGHVVSSTKKFVRVEFLSGEERTIPLADLEDVGGKRGTPAPTRRKRKPAAEAEKPAGRSHVTRKKTDE